MTMDSEAVVHPKILIFMGVSGCGKSTVAKRFCERSDAAFLEGDDYHSPENKARMHAGIALTDEDRLPWLQTLAEMIRDLLSKKPLAAVTCSALKQSYRDILQGGDARVKFVFLHASQETLQGRVNARKNHFMSPDLLKSQFETLEPPADAWAYEITTPVEEIVDDLLARLNSKV